jgi:hypothetical protein
MLNVLLWIDDSYGQYLIPKGSTVFMAIWAMHQDEKIFKNADKFDPDRYLKHPKFANEYATSVDYENQDKFIPPPMIHLFPESQPG